ncbi:MAG: hypothetical protein PHQ52_08285, partial [Candidatus Omnitrophica bacterium]|nr:hypothetical protein [Candidatus Omnitrophota bacterium]
QEGYNPYFKLLAGGISPIETILTADNSAIALRSIFSEMGLNSDQIQIHQERDMLNALIDSAKQGKDFTVIAIKRKNNEPLFFQLSFDEKYKGIAKNIGEVLGKPVYGFIMSNEQSLQWQDENGEIIILEEPDIDSGKKVKQVLMEMALIQDEARRKIKDPATGVSRLDINREKLQDYIAANFTENGKPVWRKLSLTEADVLGSFDLLKLEDTVRKLGLPLTLSSAYLPIEYISAKHGMDITTFDYLIREMLVNAVDAVRSMYDREIYPKFVGENYKPSISLSCEIDDNDNFTIKVIDNGLGEYAADTNLKKMAPMYYLGQGGNGIARIREIAQKAEGRFSLTMKNRNWKDMEHGITVAEFSVPISKLESPSANIPYVDTQMSMRDLEKIDPVSQKQVSKVAGIEVEKKGVIISPDPTKDWMSYATYNAGVVDIDGRTFVFFRAHNKTDRISRTGLAVIDESGNKKIYSDQPLINPQQPWEEKGIEDLRVTRISVDGKDTLVFVGAAYDGDMARSVMFSISVDDFKNNYDNDIPFDQWKGWKEHFLPFGDNYGKDGTLFPEKIKIDGKEKYALLYRGHSFTKRNEVRLAVSDSLDAGVQWESIGTVFSAEYSWENFGLGTGPAPIKTEYGWVVIYHAVDQYLINGQARHSYTAAIAILDLEDPTKVLYRSDTPFMAPEADYEQKGFVSNVVFPTGTVVRENKGGKLNLDLYYGAADDLTGVANINIDVKGLVELANVKIDMPVLLNNVDQQKDREDISLQIMSSQDYAALQQKGINRTVSVLRPETKLKIVVETNENIFWGETDSIAKENFKKNLGRYMNKYMQDLTNYNGEVEIIPSESRENTKDLVEKYNKDTDEYSMVVFRLDEFGDITKNFKNMLQAHKVPIMALNLRPPTLKKGSDKSVIDPYSL